ncbi:hypothetical protein ACM91Y_002235 [Cronobacter dublinensis]
MDKSREQFEAAIKQKFGDLIDQRVCKNSDGDYMAWDMQVAWWAWQKSRADMIPACWRTYYPDTDEEAGRAHSESGPESCAKRIASEIGGYVVPVYYGEPQQCAAGLKVKGE